MLFTPNLAKRWYGRYDTSPNPAMNFSTPIVSFEMSLNFKYFGKFEGEFRDFTFSEIRYGRVEGKVRFNKIEFIVTYDKLAIYDSSGLLIVYPDAPGLYFKYTGTVSSSKESIVGTWRTGSRSIYWKHFPGGKPGFVYELVDVSGNWEVALAPALVPVLA